MPQSGEGIWGPENMREFQQAFAGNSNPPSIGLRRVLVREGLWVLEGVNDHGEGGVTTSYSSSSSKTGSDGATPATTRSPPSRRGGEHRGSSG